MNRREWKARCRHHYPRTVSPWDPKRVRCVSCGERPPERILRALFNKSRGDRA